MASNNPYIDGMIINGTTYDWKDPNLAEEVTNLKSALPPIVKNIGILYDGNSGYISYEDGLVYESEYIDHTDYIDVSKFFEITYSRLISTSDNPNSGLAFYDASKNYISGVQSDVGMSRGYTSHTVDVPKNACFVRFSRYKDEARYGSLAASGKTYFSDKINAIQNEVTVMNSNVASKDEALDYIGI